ncbi:hypothetical protein Tco_1547411 [Tanacetum coccineum]
MDFSDLTMIFLLRLDDDSFLSVILIDKPQLCEASPPHTDLVSFKRREGFSLEQSGELEDDVLREKLSKINLLIAKIEALKDNPTPSSDFVTNGNPTSYTDLSLPDYEAFFCDSEPGSVDFTMDSFVIKSPIPVEDGDSFLEKFETTPELENFKFDSCEERIVADHYHSDIISRIVKTRARGFVLRSLDLHILIFILGIQYPNLIDM